MRFPLVALILIATVLLACGRPLVEEDALVVEEDTMVVGEDALSLVVGLQFHCGYPLNANHNANIGRQYAWNSAYEGVTSGEEEWESGKSGYPHEFENKEELVWGKPACDNLRNYTLYEYPLYDDNKTIYKKDKKRKAKTDRNRPTPYRATYRNHQGGILLCGVMAHETQEWDNVENGFVGHGRFHVCQPV
ncbi:hypothetical protein KC354_g1523 [Hortaea werneckii]|nr:hypothetical protein KC354_g1523 [Hortaea werneckii]